MGVSATPVRSLRIRRLQAIHRLVVPVEGAISISIVVCLQTPISQLATRVPFDTSSSGPTPDGVAFINRELRHFVADAIPHV